MATIEITNLVGALSKMSPLARQKIRATLADPSQEITWNTWTQVFNRYDPDAKELKACGCLMLDGYYKEHPPQFILIADGPDEYWTTDDPVDWVDVLARFYEMEDDEWADASDKVSATANAYDRYVKQDRMRLVKHVRGVEVLRTPARRKLIELVDEAEALAQ